jgi:hypothetical protein
MATQLSGIVVAFDAMRGVILLQHRSFPTIEDLAEKYAASAGDHGFWFASFDWASVDKQDKADIQALQSASVRRVGTQGKKRKQVTCKSIRSIILGCAVVCTIIKDPKRRADWVSIDISKKRYPLPDRRVKSASDQAGSAKEGIKEKRDRRMSQSDLNNLARPWGGISN